MLWAQGEPERLLHETVGGLAARWAAHGEVAMRPFLSGDGHRWTFAALDAEVAALATGLAQRGLRCGDRVTTALRTGPRWVITALALARLGVVNVLANPRYRPAEMAYLIADSGSVGVIGGDPVALRAAMAQLDAASPQWWATAPGDPAVPDATAWADLAAPAADHDAVARAGAGLTGDDPLYVIYTSGTTGRPKGSVTRHGAALRNAFSSGERMGFTADDKLLCYLPMSHTFGAVNAFLNPLTHAGALHLEEEFDGPRMLATIEHERITAVYGVPTHYLMLVDAHRSTARRHDLSSLARGCVGGGEVDEQLADAIEVELGIAGLTNAYGMTESTALITQSDHRWPRAQRLGTVGAPMPGVEVRTVGPDGVTPTPTGEPGDVHIRGFNVHAGYLNIDPDPSAVGDGWWATGDIGALDEHGCLRILGRSKDMYKTSGFNVYPVEIENHLLTHPAVAEVAIVGVPDPRKLEAGAAFVVPAPGAEVDPDDLRAHVRAALAGYKVPDHVLVVDELPKSAATLKVQKHLLRQRAQALLAPTEPDHAAAPGPPR